MIMRAKDVFSAALMKTGITQRKLAEVSGYPEQSIGQKINVRETIKAREFFELLGYIGVGTKFYTANKKKGSKPYYQISGTQADIRELFSKTLEATGETMEDAANLLETSVIALNEKVYVRASIKMSELFTALELLGAEVEFYVEKTNQNLYWEKEDRVMGMSDGVIYDTRESALLATSFYADGSNEFGEDGKAMELYVDKDNRYFFAEYNLDSDVKPRIKAAPVHVAYAFLQTYGPIEEKNRFV